MQRSADDTRRVERDGTGIAPEIACAGDEVHNEYQDLSFSAYRAARERFFREVAAPNGNPNG